MIDTDTAPATAVAGRLDSMGSSKVRSAHDTDSWHAMFDSWPPALALWKSRLPLIVVPVLVGFQKLQGPKAEVRNDLSHAHWWELALLFGVATYTGYLRLPFSATWWIVLCLAFTLERPLLLGAAAALSLCLLLGWYGARLQHPHAVSALWGGSRRKDGQGAAWQRCWQAWDLFVHALPAMFVLYLHGPWVTLTPRRADASLSTSFLHLIPQVQPGTASLAAVLAALPMNALWLIGLELRLSINNPKSWSARGIRLADTNVVYRVMPELPAEAWQWIYCSHWLACGVWAACLLLPSEVLAAYAIFVACGLTWLPYTTGWWCLFLASILSGGSLPLLEGICWCCAVTTSVGFYGTQLLAPYAFQALVRAWVMKPILDWAPVSLRSALEAAMQTTSFSVAARLGDLCLHLVPTSSAIYLFKQSVSAKAALVALPTNLMWLATAGFGSLAETNRVYRVEPNLKAHIWWFIYGTHWFFCIAAYFYLTLYS